MKHHSCTCTSPLRTFAACFAAATASLAFVGAATAAPVPQNLGNGLAKLVESNLAVKSVDPKSYDRAGFVNSAGRVYSDAQAANYAALTILDDAQERILVRVNPDGRVGLEDLIANLKTTLGSFDATAVDNRYHGLGVFDAFISLDDVPALATAPGV